MAVRFPDPESIMRRAIELARRGAGRVEPNPLVGAVVVDDGFGLLGEGWHEAFGGPHAEIHALRQAGEKTRGATLFVTLEPCCHHGKTPPCVDAVIQAGIARVVVGRLDPARHANGQGVAKLRAAGVDVEVGLLADEATRLLAPFAKLVETGRPYVLAKWAMSLDGKIATRSGESKWISNETSRARAHQLRGRMDAIIVGSGTVQADDPLLTARPAGPRVAARVVVDSRAAISNNSQLVRTAAKAPVIVATCAAEDDANARLLSRSGVELLRCPAGANQVDLKLLLDELGRRGMTNVLLEGGSRLLGAMFDNQLVDEAHVFIAPRIIGGADAVTAVAGVGDSAMESITRIDRPEIDILDGDVYVHGPLIRTRT